MVTSQRGNEEMKDPEAKEQSKQKAQTQASKKWKDGTSAAVAGTRQ